MCPDLLRLGGADVVARVVQLDRDEQPGGGVDREVDELRAVELEREPVLVLAVESAMVRTGREVADIVSVRRRVGIGEPVGIVEDAAIGVGIAVVVALWPDQGDD